MIDISKRQFNRAIENDSLLQAHPQTNVATRVPTGARYTSRIILIMIAIAVGLTAGWLGGRALTRQMSKPPIDASTMEMPPVDNLTPLPSREAQPPSKHDTRIPVASQPAPEAEQPDVALKLPKEPEASVVPPKPTRVDKEESASDPVKEIGREALRKISTDVKQLRRGVANKNEEDGSRK